MATDDDLDERPDLTGLDHGAVAERVAQGRANTVPRTTSRTVADILRANVFTRFNAILGSLLAVILVVGPIQDALFGIVLVTNAVIGIVQELRAKATLDRLALLSTPRATVIRAGTPQTIAREDVVVDDLLRVGPGDEIVVDAVVVESTGLEADESLLTGESEPVAKAVGDEVLSGSFVAGGSGHVRAIRIGEDAYAARFRQEAQRFDLVRSELRTGIDRILRYVTYLMLPAAVLLVGSQLVSNASVPDAIRGSVAGVGSMIPEGLVLLTSVAFAVGVVRLGRQQVLVDELAAIEGLARVDVLCLDKTGTLTEGRLTVTDFEDLEGGGARDALGALAAADATPNASLRALNDAFPDPGWSIGARVPFSSARKWSAVEIAGHGCWVLGAPEVLLTAAEPERAERAELAERVEAVASTGRRVLLVASAEALEGERLPAPLVPRALVVLEEQIRPDAAETVAWFAEEGVGLRVLSGDHPATVAAVAARVGIDVGDGGPVDARQLSDDPVELARTLEHSVVYGRVTPVQKRAMVHALQQNGHVVAMTGDGVNDVLALKDADLGIAMGSGSAATRAVGRVVLLDDSFARLPGVVAEGRRVIANIERVANLFLTKTVYATLLAIAVGVARLPFPFYPRHLTIVSSLTIGIPAFFLALAPNPARAHPGFVARVLRFAVPAGTVAAAATFSGYALAREQPGVDLYEARTTATLVLFLVALWVLGMLARPYTAFRRLLVGSMVAAFLVVLAVPAIRSFFALHLPPVVVLLAGVGTAAIACAVLELGWHLSGWIAHRLEVQEHVQHERRRT